MHKIFFERTSSFLTLEKILWQKYKGSYQASLTIFFLPSIQPHLAILEQVEIANVSWINILSYLTLILCFCHNDYCTTCHHDRLLQINTEYRDDFLYSVFIWVIRNSHYFKVECLYNLYLQTSPCKVRLIISLPVLSEIHWLHALGYTKINRRWRGGFMVAGTAWRHLLLLCCPLRSPLFKCILFAFCILCVVNGLYMQHILLACLSGESDPSSLALPEVSLIFFC